MLISKKDKNLLYHQRIIGLISINADYKNHLTLTQRNNVLITDLKFIGKTIVSALSHQIYEYGYYSVAVLPDFSYPKPLIFFNRYWPSDLQQDR